jgi:hypothetical protein
MRRSFDRFSQPETSNHTLFLVDFITITSGPRFSVHTGYTLRPVDNVERFLSGLDHAQWRHTLGIVHRHYRAFQRGRRGATLRKGRSTMGSSTTVYLR